MSVSYRTLIVCGLLVLPSFSQARITVTLEHPTNGGSASGSTVISGWAFSDIGAPITVTLHVNGEPFGPIPCCGPRQAVVEVTGVFAIQKPQVWLKAVGVGEHGRAVTP